ncbi:MAG: hypothetical protein PHT33_11745, partial [bacterium]|nr:hypothetical protein [bacterium]
MNKWVHVFLFALLALPAVWCDTAGAAADAYRMKLLDQSSGAVYDDKAVLRGIRAVYNPEETVVCAVECSSSPVSGRIDVDYSSEMLLTGDADYDRDAKRKWHIKWVDLETRKMLVGSRPLVLIPSGKGRYIATFDVSLKNHPFGFFNLSLVIKDVNGKELGRCGLPYHVVPAITSKKNGNLAGYDDYGSRYSGGALPEGSDKVLLKKYGHSWAHIRANWRLTHLAPGKITGLDSLDKWVEEARRQDSSIIMCLANGHPDSIGLTKDASHWDMSLYREWAEAVISRYRDKVAVWDVWNEPDSKGYAQAEDRDIQAIKIVYELKQKYCPGTKVIISTHTCGGLNYLKRILDKGAAPYLNGIGLHPYRGVAPEMPQSCGYIDSRMGQCTLASDLQEARKLLLAYKVQPADLYIDEMNWNLNTLTHLNENDQMNYMVRAAIIAWDTGYTKCLTYHAWNNGRLGSVAFPNLVNQMSDTESLGRIDAGDPEVYAYHFMKSDGGSVIPVWSINNDKMISVSGFKGKPVVADIYGNPVAVDYDARRGSIDCLRASQSPLYIAFERDAKPHIAIAKAFSLDVPTTVEAGKPFKLTATVRLLPSSGVTLAVQTPDGWTVKPESKKLVDKGDCVFEIVAPASLKEDSYPVIVTAEDGSGKTIDIQGVNVSVKTASAVRAAEYGIIMKADFEDGTGNWLLTRSMQQEIGVVLEDGNNVLKIVQKGIDHPAAASREHEALKYAVLEFDFKVPAKGQPFCCAFGNVRLEFDDRGNVSFTGRKDKGLRLSVNPTGTWHKTKLFVAAEEGWCKVWVDGKYLGIHEITGKAPVESLLFM